MFKLLAVVWAVVSGIEVPVTTYHGVRTFATLEECQMVASDPKTVQQGIDIALEDESVPKESFRIEVSCEDVSTKARLTFGRGDEDKRDSIAYVALLLRKMREERNAWGITR